jgi:sigma-B regulation protein RsbU (phosphoserine phosphatase)
MARSRVRRKAPPSEPASLSELVSELASSRREAGGLEAGLRIVVGHVGASRGALFVPGDGSSLRLRAASGLPSRAPATLDAVTALEDLVTLGPGDEAHDRHGLALLVPISRRDRASAVLGLGPLPNGRPYDEAQRRFLRAAADALAVAIDNRRLREDLRRTRQQLSLRSFELENLFEWTRDLTGGAAEEAIVRLAVTTAMGHFVVSRGAVYLRDSEGLTLAHARGLGRGRGPVLLRGQEVEAALGDLSGVSTVAELPEGPLRLGLERARLALAVRLRASEHVDGLLAIGERASGMSFSEQDRQLAQTLARQASGALESARLQKVREEKKRQDRELQVAREIQQGLLPSSPPEVAGFDLAGQSRPCFEVGGDAYDWIPLAGGRVALVVADVAGKGTPASLLMASAHAFVHALAGRTSPALLVETLGRFLFARSQASRFVTLFYAELDPATRALVYVNAGHVPPWLVRADGTLTRLEAGGPALGLLLESAYEVGEVEVGRGDVLAVVTDGVTEAMSSAEEEFGDRRVDEALLHERKGGASAVLRHLVAAVTDWTQDRLSDDLTALILKGR